MREYKKFVNLLESELQSFLVTPKENWKETALRYVNGFAADELRRLVKLETRRENGAFFTHSGLGTKVLSLLKPDFTKDSIVYDPACGASNLLICAADFAREQNSISNFEENLFGTDIHSEFIETSRLRLQMNELLYGNIIPDEKIFENNIIEANGLIPNAFYKTATHILVNPPFNQIISDDKLTWAKGKVSAAALFIDKIIQYTKPGVSIIAILPDVLRSGSRYNKWRTLVGQSCIIERVKLLGQFDEYADVDVFAIKLSKRNRIVKTNGKNNKWHSDNTICKRTISDLFDICVGPVVDNRDAKRGPSHSYIVSRGLKGWSIQNEVSLNRKHEGKIFKGPFVVVKRTSRMGDARRAVSTIINFKTPVFVDNHLIILTPKSGTLKDCRNILKNLKDKKTDEWLNDKIRCRHLTVKIVSEIPIWQDKV